MRASRTSGPFPLAQVAELNEKLAKANAELQVWCRRVDFMISDGSMNSPPNRFTQFSKEEQRNRGVEMVDTWNTCHGLDTSVIVLSIFELLSAHEMFFHVLSQFLC